MIVDCFPFFNELDLLELRLHELDPVVDQFVICEATKTFTNKPKPMYFADNRSRYADFADKITYVPIERYDDLNYTTAWDMDHYQKEIGFAKAQYLFPKATLFLVGDLDEIPRADAVRQCTNISDRGRTLCMDLFYYWLNCRCEGKTWRACKAVRPNNYEIFTHLDIRYRSGKRFPRIPNAGWHFSYIGDVEKIRTKLTSFAHEEYGNPPYTDPEYIAEKVSRGEDLFNRKYNFQFLPDVSHLPEYVQQNHDKYGKYIKCASR